MKLAVAKWCGSLAVLLLAGAGLAAETPEDMLREAYQLDGRGETSKAAAAFQAFAKKHPNHAQVTDARYRLAKALESLGQAEEAMVELKAVLSSEQRQFRNRPDALYLLGKMQASRHDYAGAATTFDRMLAEGAGLHEEEVLSLCAGYYAVLGKFDDSAAKLNILRRRQGSALAETAGYKLALLWLKAERTDFAVTAIEDLASQFPANAQIPELLLMLADVFQRQNQPEKGIAVTEQLRERYPKSPEALAGTYMLGVGYRQRKEFEKAVTTFEEVSRRPEFRRQGMAAEALLQAADVCFFELADAERAMGFYEEAAKLARDSGGDRRMEIMEQCYFRLAEHYYQTGKFSVAQEYYLLLRNTGTKLNILGRILACQAALGEGAKAFNYTDADVQAIEQKIAANPGTAIAAEGEVFLADRKLNDLVRRKAPLESQAQSYEAILTKYPPRILATDFLHAYIYVQIGACHASGISREAWAKALAAYERALEVQPDSPYKVTALENVAALAERLGDKRRAFDTYAKLYAMAAAPPSDGGTAAAPGAKGASAEDHRALDYLKAMVTRAGKDDDLVSKSLAMLRRLIETKGELSEEAREARFHIGELYHARGDFPAAAKAFREFVSVYGPKQEAGGELADPPWRPKNVDPKVLQVFRAAVRIAHAWYAQGHQQNMVAAYEWIVRNFSEGNKYMAEAQYCLAQELVKGRKAETPEAKRAYAEKLWTAVVNSSLDFGDPKFKDRFHYWAAPRDSRYADVEQYVKAAIMKAGEAMSAAGEHGLAAEMFNQYLVRYPPPKDAGGRKSGANPDEPEDELLAIARYALGREYVALGNATKLIETYRPYLFGLRDDRFRVSALKLLGYHAGAAEKYDEAIEGYATLLDEYGPNKKDPKGQIMPLTQSECLRRGRYNWDGIRMPPPGGLDLGEIRFALGYLYWKQEKWDLAVQALAPFLDDPELKQNKSRDRALYMSAQSLFRLENHAESARQIAVLLRDHPRFEAAAEAYTYAARAYHAVGDWKNLDEICTEFVLKHPRSEFRPRVDLMAALSLVGKGRAAEGLAKLKGIASSDTYEDVKADAAYYAGKHFMGERPPAPTKAIGPLEESVRIYPRETSCLELGKVYMALGKWEEAQGALDRARREFPKGSRRVAAEAGELLAEVQKRLAADRRP